MESLALCEQVLDLTADDPEIPFADLVASPRAWAFIASSCVLLVMGRSDEAHTNLARGFQLAESDPETLGWAHMFAAVFHLVGGGDMDVDDLVEHARAASEIADRLGDAFSRTWARFWDAYATLAAGDASTAQAGFSDGLANIESSGSGRESECWFRNGLAAALVAGGQVDEGIDEGRRAVAIAEEHGLASAVMLAREALASWLLDRDAPGDVDEAAEHLRGAEELARELGHVISAPRYAALRARFTVSP